MMFYRLSGILISTRGSPTGLLNLLFSASPMEDLFAQLLFICPPVGVNILSAFSAII
jgi:hypothetical protein